MGRGLDLIFAAGASRSPFPPVPVCQAVVPAQWRVVAPGSRGVRIATQTEGVPSV